MTAPALTQLSRPPRRPAPCRGCGTFARENTRLQAQLDARGAELQAATARIVKAGDAERRRLERNLHDGAQQRLVAVAVHLRRLASRLSQDPEADRILAAAQDEVAASLRELRELARGLHPAVLTTWGLGTALEDLAARATVPVEAVDKLDGPLEAQVEAAAYYVVSESLANVSKHAAASRAVVTVRRRGDGLFVEIADDGVGGADPGSGSGLRGLADRVNALGGRLHVTSRPGRGTTVRAEIPLCQKARHETDATRDFRVYG